MAEEIDPILAKLNAGLPTDPSGPPTRNLPSDVVVKYRENIRNKSIAPLVDIEDADPIIYNRDNFMDYYRDKALKKLSPEDQAFYEKADPENKDSFLALRGGLPDFEQYQKVVREYEKTQINPTDWTKMDSSKTGYKPEGYRYGAGKPDKESITKRK